MIATLGWYVAVSALGWLAWPLAFRLLPGLPDRGYTLSRALGLLLVGYLYWLLGVLGFLQNTVGGILLAILIVLGAALWVGTSHPDRAGLADWLRENRRVVLTAEVLFFVAFAGWAFVRAYNPEILGTEKPMELAFLNGVRRSPALPPNDPWLSGFAISYYYFGYVIIVMLAKLTGVATSVAFNLGIALLFALTLLGSYGLVYNLVAAHRAHVEPGSEANRGAFSALLGPLIIGVMGNLGGVLEFLRALGAFGARFWVWLDIVDLSEPAGQLLMPPSTWRHWWWWRASRVIHDRDAAGVSTGLQPIDEFPQFSFLLGDMHPHVLALPFVLLALALAFNLLAERTPQRGRFAWAQMALITLCFGGLAFLNTWDLPIYLFVLIGALVVRRVRLRGYFDPVDLVLPVSRGATLALLGGLAYLPWYISFSSQAAGILPNAIFATRLHQFLVMFGPMLVVIAWFVLDEAIRRRARADWGSGAIIGGGVLLSLIVLAAALSFVAVRADPDVRAFAVASAGLPIEGQTANALQTLVPQAVRTILMHRLAHPLTPLLLTGLIVLALAALLPRPLNVDESAGQTPQRPASSAAVGFALVLIVTGALLTLGPEFLYLRDNFGQRLNTIFKFYYAAWILWGVAAAFAAHVLLARLRMLARAAFAVVLAVLVLAGLIYPALAIPAKAGGFTRGPGQPPPTLDGIDFIRRQYPGDHAGIEWLAANAAPDAVVLEAVGGAYSYFGRVSSATGVPTVIGWANHQRQWRGARYAALAGTREQDAQEIYDTPSIERARELLARYGVTYVFVGSLEQSPGYASPAGLAKFDRFLPVVFRADGVTIYRADQPRVEGQP